MKDAYEVLTQKEADLSRVRNEIESLRTVAPLLVDDLNSNDSDQMHLISAKKKSDQMHLISAEKTDEISDSVGTDTDGPPSSVAISHAAFWNALKRAR